MLEEPNTVLEREVRCKICNALLFKLKSGEKLSIEIKCQKCKNIVTIQRK